VPRPVVIVDCFGVLIREAFCVSHVLYERVKDRIAYEELWSRYQHLCLGEIVPSRFWHGLEDEGADWRETERRYLGLLDADPEADAVTAELAKLADLAVLSESPEAWLAGLLAQHGLAGRFRAAVSTARAHQRKPSREFYEFLLDELAKKVGPLVGRVFYAVDDRLQNLRVLAEYGVRTIWYAQRDPDGEYRADFKIRRLSEIVDIVRTGLGHAPDAERFGEAREVIERELVTTFRTVDAGTVAKLCDRVASARRVFIGGQGRSGLIAQTFSARLSQLGLAAYVAAHPVTPAIARGDLFVACSGTGSTATTLVQARRAKEAGAHLVALTAAPGSELATLADTVVRLPGSTIRRAEGEPASAQFGGALFEQTLFLTLEAAVLALTRRMGISFAAMARRHANLE